MAQYQITIDTDEMQQLFSQDQGMAKLVEKVLNKILEAEVTESLGVSPYERSEDRRGYRNGYRHREMKTRVGTLELAVLCSNTILMAYISLLSHNQLI